MTKDVTDPEFPHGTERGYFRGCHARCCVHAHSKAQTLREMAVARDGHLDDLMALAQTHLLRLLDYGTIRDIEHAAQVDPRTTRKVRDGTIEHIRRATVMRLLQTTPADVAAGSKWGNKKLALQQSRSMMRLGYTLKWQTERTGVNMRDMPMYERISKRSAEKIAALAAEVGDREGPSRVTAERARRQGWHVPGAYDEHGDLIPWAVRVDERAEAAAEEREQRRADYERIQALYERGVMPADIVDATGLSVNTVQAALKARSRLAG